MAAVMPIGTFQIGAITEQGRSVIMKFYQGFNQCFKRTNIQNKCISSKIWKKFRLCKKSVIYKSDIQRSSRK